MSEQLENRFCYNHPVPPKLFVGREAEVRKILERLSAEENRGGSLISGEYGIGKTSLLNYLRSEFALESWASLAPEKTRFVFLPGTIVTGFVEQDFWIFVFQDIRKWFGELEGTAERVKPMLPTLQKKTNELIELVESDRRGAQWEILDFFDRLGREELMCVVLLDNLGVLFGRVDPDDPIFFRRLRSLLQRPGQRGFSLVAASEKSPDELFSEAKWEGSRFDSGMLHIALKGLGDRDVDRLIDVATQDLPLEYQFDSDEQRFLHIIREQTGGHPGKIQRAAFLLLERKLPSEEADNERHQHP